ncbi:BZ3500_MvSof-1268-A1-R1_Chr5-1g07623 [Microbotryum saponariae]|uniref:BZ3500_MvSof-1268-A1-R1_Chr5-1g07623 protein n=1 Tax=Microbotryum saponariae TaxID=289078 RepID=A0A2X0LES4_9BASI|nr:BZ3500_MvSof-1268-A1-R1_Chr5-1g07623 [Microbotryum saponariae]SDA05494.1 BZ3501_MvSof-1269-A2-R1_Chr5-2g07447 [Microbotryum saponariae]
MSAPQRSCMGYVCPICPGGRMPKSRAIRHASTKKHRRAVKARKASPIFRSGSDSSRLSRSPPLPRGDDEMDWADIEEPTFGGGNVAQPAPASGPSGHDVQHTPQHDDFDLEFGGSSFPLVHDPMLDNDAEVASSSQPVPHVEVDDDDEDEEPTDRLRKRRRTKISLVLSDNEGGEDQTFRTMHSRPQHSTPHFDGPSNVSWCTCAPRVVPHSADGTHNKHPQPPNAASGQDGLSVSAATISARLDSLEMKLAQLIDLLPRLTDLLTGPSLDEIRSDVGSAAKIFVSTPFLCKHLGAAPMFATALRKGGLVSESDVKHRAFYKSLMRYLPSALMQGRTELEDHIKRAQSNSDLLGPTMRSWYRTLDVVITDEHWQVVKQRDTEADHTEAEPHKTVNVAKSKPNSFAEKMNRVSTILAEVATEAYLDGEYKLGQEFDHQRFLTDQFVPVMPRHAGINTSRPGSPQGSIQMACLEVVENPDHEINFALLVEGCVQAEKVAAKKPNSKKKKKNGD